MQSEAIERTKRIVRRRFQKTCDSIHQLSGTTSVELETLLQMEGELKELEEIKHEFDSLHSKLLPTIFDSIKSTIDAETRKEIETELEDTWVDESEKISKSYATVTAIVRAYRIRYEQAKPRQSIVNSTFNTSSNDVGNKSKLKPIEPPKFDGDPRKFLEFKELFTCMIHENENLPTVRKMYYLKEAVIGEAAVLLRDFGVSESAYNQAWARLTEWYENKRAIIRTYFRDLFAVKKIKDKHGIRQLVFEVDAALRGLTVCGEHPDNWGSILSYFVSSKLDDETRETWENSSIDNSTFPPYKQLKVFLMARIHALDNTFDSSRTKEEKSHSALPKFAKKSFVTTTESKQVCAGCGAGHRTFTCSQFLQWTPQQRFEAVKKARCCLNCFGSGHNAADCIIRPCKKCSKKHNTLLHFEKPDEKSIQARRAKPEFTEFETSEPSTASKTCSKITKANTFVILPTAVVYFTTGKTTGRLRLLFDSASQTTAISDVFVHKRKITTEKSNVNMMGIGGMVKSSSCCSLTLFSRHSTFAINITADVLPAHCISYNVPRHCIQQTSPSQTPAPSAEASLPYQTIDLILGAEYYERCICSNTLDVGGATYRKTQFGWTISGSVNLPSLVPEKSCNFVMSSIPDIQEQLQKFWNAEEVEVMEDQPAEYAICDRYFADTTIRKSDGRFCVRLPFKVPPTDLGESRSHAHRSLIRGEKTSDCELRRKYIEFMQEYIELGHMTALTPTLDTAKSSYFIPHKAVAKPSSTTTKLRVVFNASSKTSSGLSLNDTLMMGRKLQSDLDQIIISFRMHTVAFSADIAKMYRQILIHEDDRPYQRILWRNNQRDPVSVYQLNTVTYGTTPASYLATKCLAVLAKDALASNPDAARVISHNFYMDDLLTGAANVDAAYALQQSVHSILSSGCFQLRKYTSNSSELLAKIDPELVENSKTLDFENDTVLILGLAWEPSSDLFRVKFNFDESALTTVTKRAILAIGSKVFDPIGILSPVTIRFKLLLQVVWKQKLQWDETVPDEISSNFREYLRDLLLLRSFVIRRPYAFATNIVSRRVVGFCDASIHAYCAVVYIRSQDQHNRIENYFCCSKTRVAPIKNCNIHRLELESALLLSKLVNRVCSTLDLESESAWLFSDSTTTLSWLSKPSNSWKIYVANRVRKIQTVFTISNFAYINTKDNPADLGTRGIQANKLKGNSLWEFGPGFLLQSDYKFVSFKADVTLTVPDLLIEKSSYAVAKIVNTETDILYRFSSYSRLLAVVACIFRFILNCLRSSNRITLSSHDCIRLSFIKAFNSLILLEQRSAYSSDIVVMLDNKPLPRRSPLYSLNPFIDKDGILRLTGRLNNSLWSYDKRHPIILPPRCRFLCLYITHIHCKYFHATQGFIRAFLSTRFWVVGGSNGTVKRIIRNCVTCARHTGAPASQIIGQLPIDRTMPSRPFSSTGVDFAGPFDTKCTRHRSTRHYKSYLAVYVCFATRAVHLELTSDLTVEKFLESFRRFVARRGKPHTMHSDNAKTFVAAADSLIAHGVQWKFIPPRAPHFGGLWEAAVKSAKTHLFRVTKGQVCTYEEYCSLFTEIEGILNSRPLCTRRVGEQDEIITPGHFLTGDHILLPSTEDSNVPLQKRLLHRQQLIQSFWSVWHKDYLTQLQLREKWTQHRTNICVGEVVAVRDPQLAVTKVWPLGLVEKVFADSAGDVRSVELRVGGKLFRRDVTRIIRLPFS